MRVMQLMSSAGFYGAENVCVELSSELEKLGVRCLIAVFENRHIPNLEVAEVARARSLPVEIVTCRGRVDPGAVFSIRKLIRREEIDVVQSHEAKSNVYSLLATLGSATRRVTTCHNWLGSGGKLKFYDTLDKNLLRFFDRVVAVSESIRQESARYRVPATRSTIIDNGISMERFAADRGRVQRLKAELGVPDGHKIVGTVGRLDADKNVEELIEAFARLIRVRPGVSLIVVGDGPCRTRLVDRARRLGIAQSVRFTGTRRDIPDVFGALDLFVLTSRKEGLPMVVLEAMAARVPVISTPVGAVPTVIDDGRSGRLIPAGDTDAVTGAMSTLLNDDGRARTMAENAHRRVLERFSSTRMAGRYLELYREVLRS